jgi:hypothetical protein
MKKVRLDIEDLEVTSFEVNPDLTGGMGTVAGHVGGLGSDRYTNCGSCDTPATCSECVTCDPSYCDTACKNCGTDPIETVPQNDFQGY